MLCSRAQVPFARGGRPRGTADRAPGVPKGLAMPPQLTSPFAQVPEQLHPEARRPERAQRPPGARFAPSSSHAPSYRRAGATGCPREPRHRPLGSPGEPAGLARWPRPHGWVTAGSGLGPDPEPRAPPIGGVSSRGKMRRFRYIYCCQYILSFTYSISTLQASVPWVGTG